MDHLTSQMLTSSQERIVVESLRISLQAAAGHASPDRAGALTQAAALLDPADTLPAHPSWPPLGTTVTRELEVTDQDTAAAMGHPDPSVDVLGSPRISLWCELVSEEALPGPDADLTHVGAGILVHHLGRAAVGDRVTVRVTLESVSGRRGVFSCILTRGEELVALATHHRVVIERR